MTFEVPCEIQIKVRFFSHLKKKKKKKEEKKMKALPGEERFQ